MRHKLARDLLIGSLLAVSVRTAAAATWHQEYEQGVRAMRAQDWPEAIEHLGLAVELRAESGPGDYLPYLKLGIAYFHLGQHEIALQALHLEEQFGAVARSQAELQTLLTYRRSAEEALRGLSTDKRRRIEDFVDQSLAQAAELEAQGRLDGALAALGKILGVEPANAEAAAAMARLRSRLLDEQQRQEAERRAVEFVEEGRRLAAAGRHEEAASRFRQALDIRTTPEVERLLEESLARLRAAARPPGQARREQADRQVAEALRLESEGRLTEALEALQTALAVDAGHEGAVQLHARLLRGQQLAERERAQHALVVELIERGRAQMDGSRFDEAAATFNLLLALDPENADVRGRLQAALAALRDLDLAKIGEQTAPKIAPTVALLNVASAATPIDGSEPASPVERLSSPELALTGMVVDDLDGITIRYLRKQGTAEAAQFEPVHEEVLTGARIGENLFRFNFSRDFSVDPGEAAWKVLVTDRDGLTSEVLHRVDYHRPWTRSPWPYFGSGALVALSLGGYHGYRVRRRQRLLSRQFNPYQAGAPILTDELFFGRSLLMDRVLQRIHNNSLMLYGERRIGKTSFQHHLMRRLQELDDPDYQFFPVYIDLEGTPQELFFATLAHEVLEELGALLPPELRERKLTEGVPYGYLAFVRDIREVIRALKARSTKKVKLVLLIDEVDELNAYDPKINQRLRSVFMKSFAEDLVAVVTGVGINKHWATEGSPWYNFFEEIEVKPFDREDAAELIRRPIAGVFTLDDGVVDHILDATDCRPYLIQKTCVEIVNRVHEQKRHRISIADVKSVLQAETR
jgi:tetratricopeptide (TPR) repeat protein